MRKGYSWSGDGECEVEVRGRIIHVTYDTSGYYSPGRYCGKPEDCYPDDSEVLVENLNIDWYMPEDAYFIEVIEGDRNWRRMERFCPKFIEDLYDAVYDYECRQDRSDMSGEEY